MSVSFINNRLFQPVSQSPLTPEDTAAVKIQKVFRGFQARGGLFGCGKKAIRQKQYEWFQRAPAGVTPVYFHSRCSLVLKNCPGTTAKDRRRQMLDAQKLCDRKGFDCLVIPKAKVYKNWLIETRLPITPKKSLQEMYLDQLVLYSSDPHLFDEAVSQFGHFCCHSYFTDLCGGRSSLQIYAPGVPLPRYDNIMLFQDMKSGKGKIALPDLEHCMVLIHSVPSISDRKSALCDVIRLFPHHEKQVLEIAKQYLPDADLEKFENELMRAQKEILGFHQAFLTDRAMFLQEKGITLENPRRICTLSPERLKELQKILDSELLFIDDSEIFVSSLLEKIFQRLEEISNNSFQKNPPMNIQQQLVQRDVRVSLDAFALNCIPSVVGGSQPLSNVKSIIPILLEEMAKKGPDGSFGELGFFRYHHENPYENIPYDILQIFY